jgi:hypothetical protein
VINQVTMGWEFGHLYRFTIGNVGYADTAKASVEEVEDACSTGMSALPRKRTAAHDSPTSTTAVTGPTRSSCKP